MEGQPEPRRAHRQIFFLLPTAKVKAVQKFVKDENFSR